MTAKNRTLMTTFGLLFALGGGIITAPLTASAAVPLVQKETGDNDADVERLDTSTLLSVSLPKGAHRAKNAADLAKFQEVLEATAATNYGTIGHFEVLVWRGKEAKSAMKDLPVRMKESGYLLVSSKSFESAPGLVTPVAAVRRTSPDGLIGMWIETGDGYSLLVWGLYTPDNPQDLGKPAKDGAKSKSASTASKSSKNTESDRDRQQKALKAYQDYQYVKLMGPITGPMYRSTKW